MIMRLLFVALVEKSLLKETEFSFGTVFEIYIQKYTYGKVSS